MAYDHHMESIRQLPARRTDTSQARSVAGDIANLIDQHDLEITWRSLMAARVSQSHSPDRAAMVRALGKMTVDVPDLLNGLAFHEVSVLYEFSLAHASHDARKESGQFFTPDDVAFEMATRAVAIDNGGSWIDPCCGVGNLTYWLAKVQPDPAEFLSTRMILVDRDELALLIAAVMLTLHLGDGRSGVFRSLRSRSHSADFLGPKRFPADNAILNPPYVVVPADSRFVSSSSRDLYAYFIERVLETSRRIVSITPQSFTNGSKFEGLRKVITDRLNQVDIYCFDNVPDNIFRGVKFGSQNSNSVNSTRPAILVGVTDSEEPRFRITPLMRWRTNERAVLFSCMDEMLAVIEPDASVFPKVWPNHAKLFKRLSRCKTTLSSLTVREPTEFILHVPTTPRYFITASKRSLDRSSMKTIYFRTEKDLNLAYVVLNSDIAYWWWRVFDGGMSLSEKTLMSLPIPDSVTNMAELVSMIELSEGENLVTKLNAGMVAENIKHSDALIDALTSSLLGRDAAALRGIRNNSIVAPLTSAEIADVAS